MPTAPPAAYPFDEIPEPGVRLSNTRLYDSLYPLLAGTAALAYGFAHGVRHEGLSEEDIAHAVLLVAGNLGLALRLLIAWDPTRKTTAQAADSAIP